MRNLVHCSFNKFNFIYPQFVGLVHCDLINYFIILEIKIFRISFIPPNIKGLIHCGLIVFLFQIDIVSILDYCLIQIFGCR